VVLSNMSEILSSEQAAAILQEASVKKPKAPKYNYDDRTVTGFFKLPLVRGMCQCELHSETPSRERMVVTIDNTAVCRLCYLTGWPDG